MENIDLQDLLIKYKNGKCSPEELVLVENWYSQWKVEAAHFTDEELNKTKEETWQVIAHGTKATQVVQLWPRIGVAVAVVATLLAIGFWFVNKMDNNPSDTYRYANDVAPGHSGATLTLGNGQQIKLVGAQNGELAEQPGVTITKSGADQLTYEVKAAAAEQSQQNTLSTANGETYKVLLPDGSKVWLNAASSLTFSSKLIEGGKRKVSLVGEAYFEVSKDKHHPFIVETSKQTVQVLGTHFNVNAYQETPKTVTTLLEGSVQVRLNPTLPGGAGASESKTLKPNQQSALAEGKLLVSDVDAQDAIAWQQGYFAFNSETLEEIMNRVERWYNVTVIFDDPSLKKETFIGSVSKYEQVSKVLNSLAGTNTITFKIEGNTIRVNRK